MRRGRRRRQTPRHQQNLPVMHAAPAVNAGNICLARPRVVPVIGPDATACPVGVWYGAPTSRPRPGRTSSGQHRADQGEERGGGEGRGDAGEEREGQPGRVQRDRGRKTKKKTKKQTPQDDGTSHPYRRDREPARARGGRTMTRRVTQQMGKGRAGMRLGMS